MEFMDPSDVELISKIVALIVSVFAVFKAFNELSLKKTDKLRADYDFAEKFIADGKWKELDDFLLERGYWALSGSQLKASEVRFFLGSKNPLSKFQDYKKAIKYLECVNTLEDENEKVEVRYKSGFDDNKRKSINYWNTTGYVIYAVLALLPIVYFSSFLNVGFSALIVIPVWSLSFGSLAGLCLNERGNLISAERVMTELMPT